MELANLTLKIVSPVFAELATSEKRNLRQTRDLLLPKLISGEIDVSELNIDTDGIQAGVKGNSNPVSVDRGAAH